MSPLNTIDQLLLFVIALVANAFSAFVGGGSGLIQLPALIFLGLPFGAALATHKVATVALGLGALARYFRASLPESDIILSMLLAGLPGVVLGASLILLVPPQTATVALGILTASLGIYSLLKPDLGQRYRATHRNRYGYVIGTVVLFFLGILNGSLTSGTGLFVTLWLVRWFGLDYKAAVAYTLVFVGVFWNGAGALTLGLYGNIVWGWLPALLLGSLAGGYVGAHMSLTKGNYWVKRGFEIVTIIIGLKLIAR